MAMAIKASDKLSIQDQIKYYKCYNNNLCDSFEYLLENEPGGYDVRLVFTESEFDGWDNFSENQANLIFIKLSSMSDSEPNLYYAVRNGYGYIAKSGATGILAKAKQEMQRLGLTPTSIANPVTNVNNLTNNNGNTGNDKPATSFNMNYVYYGLGAVAILGGAYFLLKPKKSKKRK